MDRQRLCCFSRGGEYLATCSSEGELKVWNTKQNSLQHTFVPSNNGSISCMSWSRVEEGTRKRRHKPHLFIGCGVGSKVIVWDLSSNEESMLLSEYGAVSSVDWDMGAARLVAGTEAGHVLQWDMSTNTVTRGWKAHKQVVRSLCCYGDATLLLTASRAVKMWSLADYSVVKKFSGHGVGIRQLSFVTADSFLSCAEHDRVLNYWETNNSVAMATLTCEEEVFSFDFHVEDSVIKLAVVSHEGSLYLYQFPLSPLPPPPISCSNLVQFVSAPQKPATPMLLQVLAAVIPSSSSHLLTLAHSSVVRPSLESITFEQSEQQVCLVRDVNPGSLLLPTSSQSKAVTSAPQSVTVLGPGNMSLPLSNKPDDLRPLKDRLGPEKKPSKEHAPTADSLTRLLEQSIASGSDKLLEEVLRVSKEKLVCSTVKGLPVHIVLPFLMKLIELLQTSPARGLELSLWIKTVLSAHAAYLLTVPQVSASLSGLHQMLESRVSTFSRLCQLQGKLDLIVSQATVSDGGLSAAEQALTTPLFTITLQETAASTDADAEEDWSSELSDQDPSDEETTDMETENLEQDK